MNLSTIRREIVFVLLASLVVSVYVLVAATSYGSGFPLDDSWIHQTYGRNFGLHSEWAFLRGEASAASTAPLYTVLLAIGYVLRIPYMLWTHGLGVAALSITAIIGANLADRITENRRVGWATGLAMIFTWHLIWAASAGMETMLFGMWTLVLIALAWRETSINPVGAQHAAPLLRHAASLLRRGAIVGAVVALAALTRPEGILLGGMIAVALLIVRPQGNLQHVIVWGVGAAIAFAIILTPYLWLNYSITGGVLPNTASAKFEQHAQLLSEPLTDRLFFLWLAIMAGGQLLLTVGVFAYLTKTAQRTNKRQLLFDWLPLFWFVGLILLYVLRLPAAYQHGRYVMPALPAFIVMGVSGMYFLLQWRKRTLIWRVTSQVLVLSTALITLVFTVWGVDIYRTDVGIINAEMVKSAEWIAENLPEDELLAIHDIGAVGYFAPRSMLDIAGLVSEEVVEIVADGDALWALMQSRDARYLMAFPNQIPNQNPNDPRLCEIYSTDSPLTRNVGHPNMTIYEIDYDATCDS